MLHNVLVHWAAMVVLCASAAHAQIRAQIVTSGLSAPIVIAQDPSNPNRQLVGQQGGRIRVLLNGVVQPTDFLNLTGVVTPNGGEQGLLGVAFSPDFASSGRVFVSFTNLSGDSVLSRFVRASDSPLVADVSSRFDFRWPGGQTWIDQPFSNHNGGNILFGADGYLYFGLGDGGSGNDPFHYSQSPSTLLGKMLRLNVAVPDNDPEGYNVPGTNPIVGSGTVLQEIWSFGLRNPWRFSFDNPNHGGTGALVIADVGQNAFEEVDYEPAGHGGRNYGWRNFEGVHSNVTSLPAFSGPLTGPIHEYDHSVGRSITGGFIYRGSSLPSTYRGRYFFADFVTSRVWSLGLNIAVNGEATAVNLMEHTTELGSAAGGVSSFGEDAQGELLIVAYSGQVYRIAPLASAPSTSCTTPDPFAALGGGTCVNGGWLPPGATPPSSPPPTTPPPSAPSSCVTTDPFAALGGGTCVNGGWLPPGVSPPSTPAPPATPPPSTPQPTPSPSTGCTTPDPFTAIGGGTCVNGGWLPPGVAPPSAPAPPPTPPPTPPTGCATTDPFVALGGGRCVNGGWLPPNFP